MNGNQGNDFLASAALLTAMQRARRELRETLEARAPAQEMGARPRRRWHLLGRRPLVFRFGRFLLIAHVAHLNAPGAR